MEIAKPFLQGKRGSVEESGTKRAILLRVLEASLKLLHPVCPFITEEIASLIPGTRKPLIISSFPEAFYEGADEVFRTFAFFDTIVQKVRAIRGEMSLPPQTATRLYLISTEPRLSTFIKEHEAILKGQIPLTEISVEAEEPELSFFGSAFEGEIKIIVPLPEQLIAKEKERLEKERRKLEELLGKSRKQLENQEFLAKAPTSLVEKLREQQKHHEIALEEICKKL